MVCDVGPYPHARSAAAELPLLADAAARHPLPPPPERDTHRYPLKASHTQTTPSMPADTS